MAGRARSYVRSGGCDPPDSFLNAILTLNVNFRYAPPMSMVETDVGVTLSGPGKPRRRIIRPCTTGSVTRVGCIATNRNGG